MKATKKDAGYQNGSPKNCCGYCTMYIGRGNCTAVEGRITPYMICKKFYKPYPNPRRGLYSIVQKKTRTTSDDWAR